MVRGAVVLARVAHKHVEVVVAAWVLRAEHAGAAVEVLSLQLMLVLDVEVLRFLEVLVLFDGGKLHS